MTGRHKWGLTRDTRPSANCGRQAGYKSTDQQGCKCPQRESSGCLASGVCRFTCLLFQLLGCFLGLLLYGVQTFLGLLRSQTGTVGHQAQQVILILLGHLAFFQAARQNAADFALRVASMCRCVGWIGRTQQGIGEVAQTWTLGLIFASLPHNRRRGANACPSQIRPGLCRTRHQGGDARAQQEHTDNRTDSPHQKTMCRIAEMNFVAVILKENVTFSPFAEAGPRLVFALLYILSKLVGQSLVFDDFLPVEPVLDVVAVAVGSARGVMLGRRTAAANTSV